MSRDLIEVPMSFLLEMLVFALAALAHEAFNPQTPHPVSAK